MEVWRIEGPNGLGMYNIEKGTSIWTVSTDNSFDKEWHPIPQHSKNLMKAKRRKSHLREILDYHFGFTGKRQFLQWVYDPDWRHNLTKNGAVIKIYKVDKRLCLVDDHQVMFVKEKATLVKTLPVNVFDIRDEL